MNAYRLTEKIARQAEITLYNTQVVLATCPLDEELGGIPTSQLLYCALYKLDSSLIPSGDLRRDPPFHSPDLIDVSKPYIKNLPTKDQLAEYYLDVKARLLLSLDEHNDEDLFIDSSQRKDTLFDHIIAELRLFTYRIGQLNTFTEIRTGRKPLFFSEDANYPSDHQFFEKP